MKKETRLEIIEYLTIERDAINKQRSDLQYKDHWNDFDWKWERDAGFVVLKIGRWIEELTAADKE